MPSLASFESVGVCAKPPKASGTPKPASSINTMSMFGASFGKRSGSTRRLWMDSCNVGRAVLADGTAGNGNTEPSSWAAATRACPKQPSRVTNVRMVFIKGFYFFRYLIFVVPMEPLKAKGAWSK